MGNWPVTAIVLAGGFGTRLRQVVSDRPKPLAEVDGKPFLTLVLKQLAKAGISRCVLSTGFMADLVEKTLGTHFEQMDLLYSPEDSPLGTAGALRKALPLVESTCALVLNGDSYCDLVLPDYFSWYSANTEVASLALIDVPDTSRYGRVELNALGQVIAFHEKGISGPGSINSGAYFLPKRLISEIPTGVPCSLEREIFPRWVEQKRLYGYNALVTTFIDIGTPESYAQAQQLLRGL